jgi:hypothetical protein
MAVSSQFTGRLSAKVLALDTADSFEIYEENSARKRNREKEQKWIYEGFQSSEIVLSRLSKRIALDSIENGLNLSADNLRPMFESLQNGCHSGVDEAKFVSSLSRALSTYHAEDVDLSEGLKVLFHVFEHLSVFPFESEEKVNTLNLEGLSRALWFATTLGFSEGNSTFGQLCPVVSVPRTYQGSHPDRERSRSDWRRMFFRALAVPIASSSSLADNDLRFRKLPVPYFHYRVSDIKATEVSFRQYLQSILYVQIQVLEDERQVDLLDTVKLLNPKDMLNYDNVRLSLKSDSNIFPLKLTYRSMLPPNLPSYKYYLDQLAVSSHDLKVFITVLMILKLDPGEVLSNAEIEQSLSFIPDDTEIIWAIFDEILEFNMVSVLKTPFIKH